MLCAISGEAPEEPVVSKKTGTVFEKRLIEKYIQENGKDPVSGEELDLEDLLPIQSARIVRPRPPTLTSIPALLATFQNEWDALALETYNVREQLAQTRKELATALYQHDAAVRVIVRLSKERDEAREALSKVTVTGGKASDGDVMMVDNESLPEDLASQVDDLHKKLSKGRKKRAVPGGWATSDEISSFSQLSAGKVELQPSSLALDGDAGDNAAIGSVQGDVAVYSLKEGKTERTLHIGEHVTGSIWTDNKVIFSTLKGSVKVFADGSEVASFKEHAGPVTAISLHPGRDIVASVGLDKSFVFYSLNALARVSRMYTDSALTACAFHPDGHLFAAGTDTGDIKIFATNTGEQAAVFSLGTAVQALTFSENGFWFAASGKDQPSVTIFDLRKEGEAAKVKELATGEARCLAWDYSGQFLATAGPTGITVQQYLKSSKKWSELLQSGTPASDIRWGPEAKFLAAVSEDGTVRAIGTPETAS